MTAVNISWALLLASIVLSYVDRLLPITDVNFQMSDVAILLSAFSLWASGGFWGAIKNCIHIITPASAFLFFSFVSIAFVLANGSPILYEKVLTSILQLALIFLVYLPLISYHSNVKYGPERLAAAHVCMLIIASVISVMQYNGYIAVNQDVYYRNDNPLIGVNGFWMSAVVVPFVLCKSLDERDGRSWVFGRVAMACIIIAILLAGIFLSVVRSALVVIVMAGFWMMAHQTVKILRGQVGLSAAIPMILAVILVGGLAYVLEEKLGLFALRSTIEQESYGQNSRIEGYQVAVSVIFSGEVLHGIGLGQTPERFGIDPIHNIYLQSFAEVGIGGFISLIAMFFLAVFHVPSGFKLRQPQSMTSYGLRFLPVGVGAAMMFYPIGYSRLDWSLFLVGCCWWHSEIKKTSNVDNIENKNRH